MKLITSEFADLKKVRITDGFWSRYQQIAKEKIIPFQWRAINDDVPGIEPSHAIRNFRIAAGLEQGEFGGYVFQDSDVAKWLEAVAYRLAIDPDPELEKTADDVIDLIAAANEVERRLQGCARDITVAVMGCVVNGPGEAREADIGIAGGDGCAVLFKGEQILGKVPESEIVPALLAEIEKL